MSARKSARILSITRFCGARADLLDMRSGPRLCFSVDTRYNGTTKNAVTLSSLPSLSGLSGTAVAPAAGLPGLFWAGLGVLLFSLSMPATRLAAPELGGTVVGLGRAVIAGLLAGLLLWARGERLPARRHWPSLAIVGLGVVIGFPVLAAIALEDVPAIYGSILIGLLPLGTALAAVARAGERPAPRFWLSMAVGVAAVLAFAWVNGDGRLHRADALLLGAVLLGGLGYAEGGRLARELDGWRVISWALVFTAPFLCVPLVLALATHGIDASPRAWLGFGYVTFFSMFLGFFAWYRGLARAGVAKAGQLQLLQPFLSLGWSAALLGEAVPASGVAAVLVALGALVVGQRSRVARTTGDLEIARVPLTHQP